MKRLLLIAALLVLLYGLPTGAFGQPWSGILAPARATDWSRAGIVGGIPSGAWPVCTLYSGQPTPMPSSSTAAQIVAALLACSGTNSYVPLATGTFHFSGAIRNVGISGVELRGQGPQSTKLAFTSGSTCQGGNGNCMLGFESANMNCTTCNPSFHNVTGGLSQGSTVLTLDSTSGLVVGQVLILDQCDTSLSGSTGSSTCSGTSVDNNAFYVSEYSTLTSDRSVAFHNGNGTERLNRGQEELSKITNISGLNVTIETPLINANWTTGLFPQVWTTTTAGNLPIHDVGVRNLSIDGTGTSNTHGLSFFGVVNHWARNVIISNISNMTINDSMTDHGNIESNYFYGCGQFNTSADYSGVNFSNNGNLLIANNIGHGCGLLTMGNGPGAGNVIFANFDAYAFQGPAFWAQHAAGVHYDLYEENVGKDWLADQIHGPALLNTLFRNAFFGWQSCAIVGTNGCGTQGNLFPIADLSYNRYFQAVNNVFGTPAVQGVSGSGYSVTIDFNYFTFSGTGSGPGTYIYNIGSGNQGTSAASAQWPHDPITETTMLRWGNWDAHNAATLFCTAANTPIAACVANERGNTSPGFPALASPSSTFPASFYTASRPSWWKGSIPFPAIGSDVVGGNIGQINGTINTAGKFSGTAAPVGNVYAGNTSISAWAGHINAIPAMDCFLNTLSGPPDGSGSILPFDADNCYTSTATANPPTFSVGTGNYTTPQTVTITDTTPSSTIYYTTDGTPPTNASPKYTHPLYIALTQNLRAFATASGLGDSAVTSATYTVSRQRTTWSLSTTLASVNPVPFPVYNRPCCGNTWNNLETARGTYVFTALDTWITQTAAHSGAFNSYTFSHVPSWANGGGSQDVEPDDVNVTAACQNVLVGVTTTDCKYKEFVTKFMQHICGVSSAPVNPIVGGCSNFKRLEGWNEWNANLYWTSPYADLATMMNDAATIQRIYCGDCLVVAGSVSAGGDGFQPSGQSAIYYTAMELVLAAWGAIPNASLPDLISIHPYPSRTDVVPVPFPTTTISNSSSFCTSGNVPNVHCRVAVSQEVAQIKGSTVLNNSAIKQWAQNLAVIGTEGGYGETQNLIGGAIATATNFSITANVATVTATNTFTAGQTLILNKWGVATYFNEATVTVLATGLSGSSFRFNFTHANVAVTSDTGTAADAVTTNFLRAAYISEWMVVVEGQDTPEQLLYAANDCTWGNYWNCGFGTTAQYAAFIQTQAWLNLAVTTGPATSVAVTGGNVWTLPITINGSPAQIKFFDGYLTTTTQSTTFAFQQNLAGVTTPTGGNVTLSQQPILLSAFTQTAPVITGTVVFTGSTSLP